MSSNGNGKVTVGALGHKIVSALPPAFLLLILMNVLFMGATLWVINHNAEQRNALLTKIVEQCLLEKMPR